MSYLQGKVLISYSTKQHLHRVGTVTLQRFTVNLKLKLGKQYKNKSWSYEPDLIETKETRSSI